MVFERLNSEERAVLTARLKGDTVEEIGESFKTSPRTVRRISAHVRRQIEDQLIAGNKSANQIAVVSDPGTISALAPLSYDDYLLQQLCGAGGMGKVYRATERSTGRPVAIKALAKSRQRNRYAVEKFLQEAQILASLKHSNIVGTEGVGRFPGGGYFIVMEFVDGTDLQSQIAKRPLEIGRAVRVIQGVAGAIAYAHRNGVVHGDLKPANVLMDKTDRVVVTDFGLAQFIGVDARSNEPHWLVGGTAGYMAPEVCRDGLVPGPKSDIYGLGALLWTLVTGFVPDGPESVHGHPLASDTLSSICVKCLATNATERYSTADDLSNELCKLAKQLGI